MAYDGGGYVGWQRQPNGISVQERIEQILKRLCGFQVDVHGASRTDTGVHALGMVAHFDWSTTSSLSGKELHRAMNALLPEDIRIVKLQSVPTAFHARFEAKRKLYRYRILNSNMGDPFRRRATWFVHGKLDLAAMRRAAKCFVGRHNFSAIAVNPGYERTTMVRRIFKCTIRRSGDEIHLDVEGDGFLYKMVRTIAGTIVEVGLGKRDAESIPGMLKSRDRKQAGRVAPAHGLFLVRVTY